MRLAKIRGVRLLGVLSLFGIVGSAHVASAVTIDFEDPPYTAGGTIVGQDGWVLNSYVGAGNGTVDISTSLPLVGSQSLLYTQTGTSDPVSGSDVSRADVITIVADGTSAADLNASFRLQADVGDPNLSFPDGQVGLFLSSDGFNGLSPIAVLLNNANSTNATGEIDVLGEDGFLNVSPYTAGNELEFRVDVNFDANQSYTVAVRDLTAGEVAFTPLGSFGTFSGGNAFPDDGDGINYTVDVALLLRGGTGRIDQITLTQVPEPTTLVLGLLSLGAVGFFRRNRR